ncbi:hypothetical protein ABBQ38_005810 [Trebouxia sp. C0009 RCD-2024]
MNLASPNTSNIGCPPVVAVRFGHLYVDGTDKQAIKSLVWRAIITQLPHQLVAMDPQRLGTSTAAYDLHFQEQFLQQKHDLYNKGFLTVEYMGKREQLPASSKGSQISPRLAEVVVKQLDPRWARQGATAALLQAAGYSTDVAVQTEFTGDLPAHLSCWSHHLGRSDVVVAKVAAPASDPSLRRLPRSIQFQGLRISISFSRSLQNMHEQRTAREADTSSKQARRLATRVKRKASKRQSQQRKQQQQPPPAPQHPQLEHADPTLPDEEEPLLEAVFPIGGGPPIVIRSKGQTAHLHPSNAVASGSSGQEASPSVPASRAELVDHDTTPPLTGKRRDPESGSESSDSPEAPSADSLAIVPVTRDDGHAQGLRRSLREHKKPRPYYSAAEPQPPDKLPASKGLQRGFFK